jgi:hypothetical protein
MDILKHNTIWQQFWPSDVLSNLCEKWLSLSLWIYGSPVVLSSVEEQGNPTRLLPLTFSGCFPKWSLAPPHVEIYHKEASITWLATKIWPAKESLQLDCAMSFDLRENISLSRLASMAKHFATETFILFLIPAFGWSAAQITTNFL